MAIVFELQTIQLIDFTKIFQLKDLKPKNIGYTNFYECCDLMEKVYLVYMYGSLCAAKENDQSELAAMTVHYY